MSWNRPPESAIAAADAEIEARRHSVRGPSVIALGLAIPITVLWVLGLRGGLTRGVVVLAKSQPVLQVKTLLIFGLTFGIIFFFACRHQRRTGRSLLTGSGSVIPCGGNWEPIEHWEWLPDSNTAMARTEEQVPNRGM